MYNPAGASGEETAPDNDDYEYVEIKNIGTGIVSLAGVRLAGGVEFDFSDGAIATLPPDGFAIVAKNAAALGERYGGGLPIAGQFAVGTLDNAGERLQLVGSLGEIVHEFSFSDAWRGLTDGDGFSLSIIDEYGELSTWDDAAAWKPSSVRSGSPGATDPDVVPNPGGVSIHEISANARDAIGDRIELANTAGQSIDLSNWYLSDDVDEPRKYALGAGTVLGTGEFLVLTERDHFGGTLDLNPLGGELLLSAFNAAGELLGYQQLIEYGASEPGITHGHVVDSKRQAAFVALSSATFGATNSSPRLGNVVINEIMYHPATLSAPEFIELRNPSGNAILLGTSATQTVPWRLRGAIDFAFPAGATISADGYVLVVQAANGADLAAAAATFRAARAVPASVPIFVHTDLVNGSLNDDGESLVLERPTSNTLAADINADGDVSLADLAIVQASFGVQSGATRASGDISGDGAVTRADLAAFVRHFGGTAPSSMYVTEDAVTYDDGSTPSEHWPAVADGEGSSLA